MTANLADDYGLILRFPVKTPHEVHQIKKSLKLKVIEIRRREFLENFDTFRKIKTNNIFIGMSANVPIVRQVSQSAILIIILVWAVFIAFFTILFQKHGIFIGVVLFSGLFILLQQLIPSSHNKGMKAIKQKDFKAALEHFELSLDFFTRNAWVDKYRAVTMLSASKMCYREMALCNIAFCYVQAGQAEKAKALYEEILKQYPDNGIAYYALNSINTFSNPAD